MIVQQIKVVRILNNYFAPLLYIFQAEKTSACLRCAHKESHLGPPATGHWRLFPPCRFSVFWLPLSSIWTKPRFCQIA